MKFNFNYSFGLISLILIFEIFGCKNNSIQRKYINGELVEGNFIEGNLLNGEIKYFNSNNLLLNKSFFNNGQKDGYSVNFNSKGKMIDSFNYCNDLLNGYQFVFDSVGNKKYIFYSYFGITCGPAIFFDNGIIKRYLFLDLHKNPIIDVKYNTFGEPELIEKFSTDTRVSPFIENGQKMKNIFIYVPDIPDLHIEYSLGITDLRNKDSILFNITRHNDLFFDTILPPPKLGFNYIIQSHVNGKGINKIYLEDLKYSQGTD